MFSHLGFSPYSSLGSAAAILGLIALRLTDVGHYRVAVSNFAEKMRLLTAGFENYLVLCFLLLTRSFYNF